MSDTTTIPGSSCPLSLVKTYGTKAVQALIKELRNATDRFVTDDLVGSDGSGPSEADLARIDAACQYLVSAKFVNSGPISEALMGQAHKSCHSLEAFHPYMWRQVQFDLKSAKDLMTVAPLTKLSSEAMTRLESRYLKEKEAASQKYYSLKDQLEIFNRRFELNSHLLADNQMNAKNALLEEFSAVVSQLQRLDNVTRSLTELKQAAKRLEGLANWRKGSISSSSAHTGLGIEQASRQECTMR
jgi:hypothetical protein